MVTKKKTTKKSTKSNARKVAKKTESTPRKKVSVSKKKTAPKTTTSGSSTAKDRLINARKREAALYHHLHTRKNTPIVFTLDDVRDVINQRATNQPQKVAEEIQPYPETPVKKKKISLEEEKEKQARTLGAASLTDILGFNPVKKERHTSQDDEIKRVPKKYLPYYKALITLREHFMEEVDVHAKETLKRSAKDDTGDLSGYAQHMADVGTDTFDRDLTLNLLSNEQDALYEIDEAIQRIFDGTYGICQETGKPIDKERLMAVPFARFSLEGQHQQESKAQPFAQRENSVFTEASDEIIALEDEDA